MIVVDVAKVVCWCPICRGKIRMDDVVTLVIRGEYRELMHFKCYALKRKRQQTQRRQAAQLPS